MTMTPEEFRRQPPEPDPARALKKKRDRQLVIGALAFVVVALILMSLLSPASDPGKGGATAVDARDTAAIAASLKQEATALLSSFKTAVARCDETGIDATASLRGSDVVGAYAAFDEAEKACLPTGRLIGELEAPADADEATKDQFKAVLKTCAEAYTTKWYVYEKMTKMLDGDSRASIAAEVREQTEVANLQLAGCVPSLMTLVQKAGGDVPELNGKVPERATP